MSRNNRHPERRSNTFTVVCSAAAIAISAATVSLNLYVNRSQPKVKVGYDIDSLDLLENGNCFVVTTNDDGNRQIVPRLESIDQTYYKKIGRRFISDAGGVTKEEVPSALIVTLVEQRTASEPASEASLYVVHEENAARIQRHLPEGWQFNNAADPQKVLMSEAGLNMPTSSSQGEATKISCPQ